MGCFILITCLLIWSCCSIELLDGIPVVFAIIGMVNYTSDAGVSLTGYNVSVSYSKHTWLGIKLDLGSDQNSDVLIVQRDTTYVVYGTDAGYRTTVADYYIPQGNTGRLNSDTQTGGDVTCYSDPDTNAFSLVFTRSLQNSQGEDWNATLNSYSMLKVCFFTSDGGFSQSNWQGSYQSCYFYEINNIISTYRGQQLFSINLNNQNTVAYGGVEGPVLSTNVFLYHTAPSGTYHNAVCVVFQLGYVQQNVGNDYQVKSTLDSETGDYFGFGIDSIAKDISYHGFQDSNITINYINAGSANVMSGLPDIVKIAFQRAVYTDDVYDVNITTSQHFCITLFTSGVLSSSATNTACAEVSMPILYPIMTVQSAVQLWSQRLIVLTVVMLTSLLLM